MQQQLDRAKKELADANARLASATSAAPEQTAEGQKRAFEARQAAESTRNRVKAALATTADDGSATVVSLKSALAGAEREYERAVEHHRSFTPAE